MPICRLCLDEKTLCKSHIYPEYMYDHCYDENHSYIEFNAKEEKYNKRRRKGLYEKLLCRDCEHVIQNYEDYAKNVLYDEAKPSIEKTKKPFSKSNYNYRLFKLFILSLLWRASISTQDGFKQASLGKYEDELRNILLKGLDTPVEHFPSCIYQTHTNGKLSNGVFMDMYPARSKYDGKTVYQFVADGLFLFVGVGVQSLKTFRNGSYVNPKSLQIGYDELAKLSSFVDMFVRLKRQGKFSVYEK